jgi:hypothetical protein
MTDTTTGLVEVRQNAAHQIHRTDQRVGLGARTLCGQRLPSTVTDPRRWRGSGTPTLTECAACFATPVDPHPIQRCGRRYHPDGPHTHTVSGALYGDPAKSPVHPRVLHPDGEQVIFAKGEHLTDPTVTSCDTPERENPMTAVGTDLHPMSRQALRALPVGTVLTVTSRPAGLMRGTRLHFGCKEFEHLDLIDAHATITYGDPVTASVDVTLTQGMLTGDLVIARRRVSLGELNEYAASIVVKELGTTPVHNAIVMEHGFYGCETHPAEMFIVGTQRSGTPGVGRLRQHDADRNFGGTIVVTNGFRHPTSAECVPVGPGTSAHTMGMAPRQWCIVPTTPEQMARIGDRFEKVTTTSTYVAPCSRDGVRL